jgi:hypothetical protein
MSIQFDWQAGTDDGEWETLAQTSRRRVFGWLRRIPWWGWVLVGLVAASSAAAGYGFLRQRVEETNRQIGFQIQSVIDLEARAFQADDVELFMEQQDSTAPDWYALQRDRIEGRCDCDPVLPGEVQEVDLRGDVARVEVLEGGAVRRARFYRQTALGWKETAPQSAFFQVPVELRYGALVFLYHRADEPYIDPLIEHVHRTAGQVCRTISCRSLSDLQFVFAIDAPPGQSPRLEGDRVVLASPWLSGIPVDGEWSEEQLRELTYWVAHELAADSVRSAAGKALTPLQSALVAEYATWYSHQDETKAPILGRVIARNGRNVVPEVMRSLPDTESLSAFIRRWLSVAPEGREIAYFQMLLNIENDALRLGIKDTFMYLQDGSDYWMQRQEQYYDHAQRYDLALPEIQVQTVELGDRRAQVVVRGPEIEVEQGRQQRLDSIVFFRLADGDWKRTNLPASPYLGASEQATSPQRQTSLWVATADAPSPVAVVVGAELPAEVVLGGRRSGTVVRIGSATVGAN